MKPYNNFRKTANKTAAVSEKLAARKFYKNIKYSYSTRFILKIYSSGKAAPMKNIFNKKNNHYFYYMNPTAANLEKHLI